MPQWPVSVKIGCQQTNFVVTGPRVWRRSLVGGWNLEAPAPCSRLKIRYEYAFGGAGPVKHFHENPIGMGVTHIESNRSFARSALLRYSTLPTRLAYQNRPCKVVGLTPISPSWEPRLALAGSLINNGSASSGRTGQTNFNADFFSCSPPGLKQSRTLTGLEEVCLEGLLANNLSFRLPILNQFQLSIYCTDGKRVQLPLTASSVAIDVNSRSLRVCYRSDFSLTSRAYYAVSTKKEHE